MNQYKLPSFILAILSLVAIVSAGDLAVVRLRCEYRANPLGIDVVKPRLSWVIK